MSLEDALAVGYASALLAFWIGSWLFVRRGAALPPRWIDHALTAAHRIIGVLPIVWPASVAALVLRAYVRIGAWPHGFELVANPESGWCDNADPLGVMEWLDG